MAKRTFSALEIFLIFLLVMMAAITVALLSLLFITSGTIENHKGKCHGPSYMLCLGLDYWAIPRRDVSADHSMCAWGDGVALSFTLIILPALTAVFIKSTFVPKDPVNRHVHIFAFSFAIIYAQFKILQSQVMSAFTPSF